MSIQNHKIIFINDEKSHLAFLQGAFNLLNIRPLVELINERTELTITIDGFQRTKSYELVKPLRIRPLYELSMPRTEMNIFVFSSFH